MCVCVCKRQREREIERVCVAYAERNERWRDRALIGTANAACVRLRPLKIMARCTFRSMRLAAYVCVTKARKGTRFSKRATSRGNSVRQLCRIAARVASAGCVHAGRGQRTPRKFALLPRFTDRNHTHAHAQMHTRTHARAHPHTHAHARALTRTHVRSRARTHVRSRARTHAQTRTRTHAHAHAHTWPDPIVVQLQLGAAGPTWSGALYVVGTAESYCARVGLLQASVTKA